MTAPVSGHHVLASAIRIAELQRAAIDPAGDGERHQQHRLAKRALRNLSAEARSRELTVRDIIHPPAIDRQHLRGDPTRCR